MRCDLCNTVDDTSSFQLINNGGWKVATAYPPANEPHRLISMYVCPSCKVNGDALYLKDKNGKVWTQKRSYE